MIEMNVKKNLLTSEGPLTLSIELRIDINDFCSFFGPSGTGKTTTLRMLAGLVKPDAGVISVNGVTWFDSEKKN